MRGEEKKLEKIRNEKKEKSFEIAIPRSFLNRLGKAEKERGVSSKTFQRLIVQCARSLSETQISGFPPEFRSLVEKKRDEIVKKRNFSTLNDEEKRKFLQETQEKIQPIDDSLLETNRNLPSAKQFRTKLKLENESIGKIFLLSNFLFSGQIFFSLSLNEDFTKNDQQVLRSFRLNKIFQILNGNFFIEFRQLAQLFIKLILKEQENRSSDNNNNEPNPSHYIHRIKINNIPLNDATFQELARIILLQSNDPLEKNMAQHLETTEIHQFSVDQQVRCFSFISL